MTVKAVLFDLDETILDRTASLKAFLAWQVNGMLRSSICDKDAFCARFIELDDAGRVWKDVVYKQLVHEFVIKDWSAQELLQSYELAFCGFCVAKQNVIEALHSLNQLGLKIGLISNGKSPFQERNFRALGVSHLFDVAIVSEAVGLRKPDKRIFELACEQLNINPEECIFVGDNPVADIKGARDSGMNTVFVPGSVWSTCEEADAVCINFANLMEIFESLSLSS